ncbi:MAG TPA: DNA-formamidopyrimidine glycosylase family protein [Actinophytocola sp.]|nr:DNA-formamidopyrimidine glycosylase family protein [Actinophytocola sp.]
MPEGDTVHRTASRLTEALGGQVLRRAELRHPRLAAADLTGRVFDRARSVGKHLFLRFGGEVSLHCHLGMDGSWRIHDPRRRAPVGHWTRVLLETADRLALGQKLLELALVRTPEERTLVAHLGPDLLDPDWSADHEAEAVRRLTEDPSRELGLALLDQTVLAGVGNVYKAEVCFLLGVSPWTRVSEVDAQEAVALSRKLLLDNATRANRVTTGDPRRGRELWVYGRERTGCLRCGGRIVVGTQGGAGRERVAPYCPHCQR